jgi:hypothetical protein
MDGRSLGLCYRRYYCSNKIVTHSLYFFSPEYRFMIKINQIRGFLMPAPGWLQENFFS